MVLSSEETEKKIEQLLAYMEQAVQDGNWFKVKQADKKMHSLLSISQTMPWFNLIEPQRKLLKKRYINIINLIAKQQSVVKVKMQNHQENKEGIAAYKEFSEGNRV
ncbi:hypothetical protein [Pseudoalteromonas distincta]|uniref:hypothetical protein n=1 Tax=Pseudoalteromonas distincta TaxID=77608 RepID=UPI0032E13738